MKNKIKKIAISISLMVFISSFLSLGIFAYYTDIGKWLDQQRTPVGDGFGQEREEVDFVEDGCGTGTILDTITGLCWDKDLDLGNGQENWATDRNYDQPVWNGSEYSWPAGSASNYPAFEICSSLTTAGHNDWRMPQRSELLTLINETGNTGEICTTLENLGFSNCQNSNYWSANEVGSITGRALSVGLDEGTSGVNWKDYWDYIACVRKN